MDQWPEILNGKTEFKIYHVYQKSSFGKEFSLWDLTLYYDSL